jgi:membrane fusion protein, multidrug efflux system
VATVDDAGVIAVRSVSVGRDFGNEIEVVNGLPEGTQIVLNPPAFLRDGMRVKVRTAKLAAAQ